MPALKISTRPVVRRQNLTAASLAVDSREHRQIVAAENADGAGRHVMSGRDRMQRNPAARQAGAAVATSAAMQTVTA